MPLIFRGHEGWWKRLQEMAHGWERIQGGTYAQQIMLGASYK